MDFKVLITESAIADLKEIVEFVAQDNPDTPRASIPRHSWSKAVRMSRAWADTATPRRGYSLWQHLLRSFQNSGLGTRRICTD